MKLGGPFGSASRAGTSGFHPARSLPLKRWTTAFGDVASAPAAGACAVGPPGPGASGFPVRTAERAATRLRTVLMDASIPLRRAVAACRQTAGRGTTTAYKTGPTSKGAHEHAVEEHDLSL